MFDVDTYRANAQHCLRMADDPLNWERKQTWLNMAEIWLGMIPPQPQRRPEEMFEKAVRDQERQQEPSGSQH
jgi:hypothetical protein